MKFKKKCNCKHAQQLRRLKQENSQVTKLYHDLQKTMEQFVVQTTAELSASIQNFQAMTKEERRVSLETAINDLQERIKSKC